MGRYAVVGCSECNALWVVEGRPETTECPRCGRRHQFEKLRALARTEDADRAREARAALLAERADAEGVDDRPFEVQERDAMAAGPDDAEYLDASGVDAEAVAAAGERAGEGAGRGSRSRREVVRDAVRELDEPTEAAVVSYAEAADVPPDYTREALTKLVRAGEATRTDGVYRLL